MNRYYTFLGTDFGYQTIARNAHNQTFVFYVLMYSSPNRYRNTFRGPKYYTEFRSDLNYQLAVL